MKRTTERADLEAKQVPEYISGCRQFEGEDLSYRTRMQTNAGLQKEWIKEQKREHQWEAENLKQEASEYAAQTDAITRARGMMEDDKSMQLNQQKKEMQDYNKMLAQQKRDRESNWKNNQEEMNQGEIYRTNMSDIMTENEKTTTSQLAPHRFVPYHFKGLTKAQQEDIMSQREEQVAVAKQLNKNQNSEEYQWAVQNLANTQQFLNNEVELAEKEKKLTEQHRDQHLTDKDAKDARWPNMYGDLNPLPDVEKDMVANASVRPIV